MDNTISSSVIYSHGSNSRVSNSSLSNRSDKSTPTPPLQEQSDKVSLSSESISRNTQKDKFKPSVETSEKHINDNTDISFKEVQEIQKLQQRDAEVKAHEQAHLSTAGQYAAGGASFTYTTGPNGKRYATGGEVPIDLSKEKDPQATLMKMTQVRRAALAPANPSAADRNIAARASMIAAEARSELNNIDDTKTNTLDSPQKTSQQVDSSDQKESSTVADVNQTFPNLENHTPTHARHRALLAYAAQS